jgi:uncharacterized phage protein gp47/JayE
MTEVFFAASVAFVGYVIYALVDEQITDRKMAYVAGQVAEDRPEPPIPIKVKATKAQTLKPKQTRAKPAKAKPVAVQRINVPEQVGMAAGSIWQYLNTNGPTAVTKLVRELREDNKTLQRSIGWLAQEGKIRLEANSKVETIALKG